MGYDRRYNLMVDHRHSYETRKREYRLKGSTFLPLLFLVNSMVWVLLFLYTNKPIFIIFIFAIPCFVFAAAKPIAGICIFFFWMIIIGVTRPIGVSLFSVNLLGIDLVVILALPAFIAALFKKRGGRVKTTKNPIIYVLIYMFIAICIGLIYGNERLWLTRDIRVFAYIIVIYFWSALVIDNERKLRILTVSLIVATAIAGLLALIIEHSALQGLLSDLGLQGYSESVGGLDVARVRFGGTETYSALMLPFLASLYFSKEKRYKYFALVALPFILIGLILSFTRTIWIAAGIGTFFSLVYTMRKMSGRKVMQFVLLLLILTTLLMGVLMISTTGGATYGEAAEYRLGRLFGGGSTSDPSVSVRIDESEALISSLRGNIFFGKGIGATYGFFISSTIPYISGWSHNGWFWLILKGGIVGFILIFFAVYLAIRNVEKAINETDEDNSLKLILIGYTSSIITLIVMSLGVNSIAGIGGAAFFGLFFCIARNANLFMEVTR
ncbi:MAG: hypothetical protein C4533_07220 [Candidatus Omnitrophota bacterium]|jgi:O-antigen ligase|nr:MAG: hypothetical protein C4533_07220 [Candidatus Omnitrophota bacterium]